MNTESIRKFIDNGGDPTINDNSLIKYAVDNNDKELVIKILNDPRVVPYTSDCHVIISLVDNCDIEMCQIIIGHHTTELGDIDRLFREAAAAGRADIVEWLLDDGRVDPTSNDNEAFINASNCNHTDVVNLLLNHMSNKRVVNNGR